MNDTPPDDKSDAADIDPGPPIAELASLTEETAPGFIDRAFRRIERRVLAAETIGFSWFGTGTLLREYWNIIVHIMTGGKPPEKEDPE